MYYLLILVSCGEKERDLRLVLSYTARPSLKVNSEKTPRALSIFHCHLLRKFSCTEFRNQYCFKKINEFKEWQRSSSKQNQLKTFMTSERNLAGT